jgi:hypothetical protein
MQPGIEPEAGSRSDVDDPSVACAASAVIRVLEVRRIVHENVDGTEGRFNRIEQRTNRFGIRKGGGGQDDGRTTGASFGSHRFRTVATGVAH